MLRVLNLEKESNEHLKWTHLEQVQNCINLPLQVTFIGYTEQGRKRIRVSAHQKEKNEKTGKRKAEEERKQWADVQREARRKNNLYEGSAQGYLDPRKGQQPFQPNPNRVGDRTNTLRWLLIGADLTPSRLKLLFRNIFWHCIYFPPRYLVTILNTN